MSAISETFTAPCCPPCLLFGRRAVCLFTIHHQGARRRLPRPKKVCPLAAFIGGFMNREQVSSGEAKERGPRYPVRSLRFSALFATSCILVWERHCLLSLSKQRRWKLFFSSLITADGWRREKYPHARKVVLEESGKGGVAA